MSAGFVYATLLQTGEVKVGKSNKKSRARAGITFGDVAVLALWKADNRHEAEKLAHEACRKYRRDKWRELFRASPADVVARISAVLGPPVTPEQLELVGIELPALPEWAAAARGLRLSLEETATVLAALRHYQSQGMGEPHNRPAAIQEVATDCGKLTALDESAIDALREKINSAL